MSAESETADAHEQSQPAEASSTVSSDEQPASLSGSTSEST